MATTEETKQAITAVRMGHASKEQQDITKRAASQAGSMGNDARAAIQGK